MWSEIKSKTQEIVKKGKEKFRDFKTELAEEEGVRETEEEARLETDDELIERVYKETRKEFYPESLKEFTQVIRRTPLEVLSETDRGRIAAVMSFDSRKVADLMATKDEMIFVNEKDLLGPLMLDKLYKSGFTNFPVVDNSNHVKGVIHTEALNALEIKKTDRAGKYMEKEVFTLHATDSLKFALSEIERTNSYYFLVLDATEGLTGFFTVQMLFRYLLGEN